MSTYIQVSEVRFEEKWGYNISPLEHEVLEQLAPFGSGSSSKLGWEEDPYYAFAPLLEGDASLPLSVDVDPATWLKPSEILNYDCCLITGSFMKDEHPDWWQAAIASRGEPRDRGFDRMEFDGLEDNPDIPQPPEYPHHYEHDYDTLLEAAKEELRKQIEAPLPNGVIQVENPRQDPDGLWVADCANQLVELSLRTDDREAWEERNKGYLPTNQTDPWGDTFLIAKDAIPDGYHAAIAVAA